MKRSKPLSLDEIQERLEKSGSESESNATPIKGDTSVWSQYSAKFLVPRIRLNELIFEWFFQYLEV